MYTIEVVAYKKSSGKIYAESIRTLKEEHENLHGFELARLIRENDPSVWDYSPVLSQFKGEFFYTVKVNYPNEVRNFCWFMLDAK